MTGCSVVEGCGKLRVWSRLHGQALRRVLRPRLGYDLKIILIEEIVMPANTTTLRQQIHELADQLPANATWDDVIEEARFRKAVETGIAAADRGAFATNEEVDTAFAKWGVKT